jgi:hypothetical protein
MTMREIAARATGRRRMSGSAVAMAVLAGLALTACGSGRGGASRAEARATLDPCAVVTQHDLAVAFGVPVAAGRRLPAGAAHPGGKCVYGSGADILAVTADPVTAAYRAGVTRAGAPTPSRPVSGPGYRGLVVVSVRAGRYGAQAQLRLVLDATYVEMLLTETAKRTGSLVPATAGLARAAAARRG